MLDNIEVRVLEGTNNKAMVVMDAFGDDEVLISYETRVAVWSAKSRTMRIHGYYSATTWRHIRAFCERHGVKAPSKPEVEANKRGGHDTYIQAG